MPPLNALHPFDLPTAKRPTAAWVRCKGIDGGDRCFLSEPVPNQVRVPPGEREWRSELLPAYRRLSRRAELLIAEVYLAGVNTRRVRRALQALFAGRIGKDAVSRAWRRTRAAWEAGSSAIWRMTTS